MINILLYSSLFRLGLEHWHMMDEATLGRRELIQAWMDAGAAMRRLRDTQAGGRIPLAEDKRTLYALVLGYILRLHQIQHSAERMYAAFQQPGSDSFPETQEQADALRRLFFLISATVTSTGPVPENFDEAGWETFFRMVELCKSRPWPFEVLKDLAESLVRDYGGQALRYAQPYEWWLDRASYFARQGLPPEAWI